MNSTVFCFVILLEVLLASAQFRLPKSGLYRPGEKLPCDGCKECVAKATSLESDETCQECTSRSNRGFPCRTECVCNDPSVAAVQCGGAVSKDLMTSNKVCREMCKRVTNAEGLAQFESICQIESYRFEWATKKVHLKGNCFNQWIYGYSDEGFSKITEWKTAQIGTLVEGTLNSPSECQEECQKNTTCVNWSWRTYRNKYNGKLILAHDCLLKTSEMVNNALSVRLDGLEDSWTSIERTDERYKWCNMQLALKCSSQGNYTCKDCDGLRCVFKSEHHIAGPKYCGIPEDECNPLPDSLTSTNKPQTRQDVVGLVRTEGRKGEKTTVASTQSTKRTNEETTALDSDGCPVMDSNTPCPLVVDKIPCQGCKECIAKPLSNESDETCQKCVLEGNDDVVCRKECICNDFSIETLQCDGAVSSDFHTSNKVCREMCQYITKEAEFQQFKKFCQIENFHYELAKKKLHLKGNCFNRWIYGYSDEDLPGSNKANTGTLVTSNSPSECQEKCQNNPTCVNWSWGCLGIECLDGKVKEHHCLLKTAEMVNNALNTSVEGLSDAWIFIPKTDIRYKWCNMELGFRCSREGGFVCKNCDGLRCVYESDRHIAGPKYCGNVEDECKPLVATSTTTTTQTTGTSNVPENNFLKNTIRNEHQENGSLPKTSTLMRASKSAISNKKSTIRIG